MSFDTWAANEAPAEAVKMVVVIGIFSEQPAQI